MAKTQFNVDIKTEAVNPLYAVAGVTELAVEFARGYATEAQKQAGAPQPTSRPASARSTASPRPSRARPSRWSTPASTSSARTPRTRRRKSRPASPSSRRRPRRFPAKVQAQLDETVADLTRAYGDLADRGEKLVAAIRKDGVKAVTAVRKAPAKSTVARRQAAKKGAAKKAPASNAAATKAPGNKSKPAAKKATAQGGAKGGATTAKKTAAKKTHRDAGLGGHQRLGLIEHSSPTGDE